MFVWIYEIIITSFVFLLMSPQTSLSLESMFNHSGLKQFKQGTWKWVSHVRHLRHSVITSCSQAECIVENLKNVPVLKADDPGTFMWHSLHGISTLLGGGSTGIRWGMTHDKGHGKGCALEPNLWRRDWAGMCYWVTWQTVKYMKKNQWTNHHLFFFFFLLPLALWQHLLRVTFGE